MQYDYARGEAQFLVTVSDDDKVRVLKSLDCLLILLSKDGKLSREEVVTHYTKFMSSQATDYGKAITRHEEL